MTSTGPTVVQHVSFLSPDSKVGCSATDGVWCMTIPYGNGAHLGLHDQSWGRQDLRCESRRHLRAEHANPPRRPSARLGQRNELGGIRCTGESRGLTCVVMAGAGMGKGFLINATGVSRVGP